MKIAKDKNIPFPSSFSSLFCGLCGYGFELNAANKKYLFHLYEREIVKNKKYQQHIGFMCPRCTANTSLIYTSDISSEIMVLRKINLYSDT